jgi:hypothetical protein
VLHSGNPNITNVWIIENNTTLVILQISKEYHKNFSGLIYTELLEVSQRLKFQKANAPNDNENFDSGAASFTVIQNY